MSEEGHLVERGAEPSPSDSARSTEGARLLGAVAQLYTAGLGALAPYVETLTEAQLVLTARGARFAVEVAHAAAYHLPMREGLWRPEHRSALARAKASIAASHPALRGAPVELVALLCVVAERGAR